MASPIPIGNIATDPDFTIYGGLSAFLTRIDVLEAGSRHDDAIALLDSALEKRGSSAQLRHARCWYEALRNSKLDSALASAPDLTGSLYMSGIVHAALGNQDKAATRQHAARTIFPGVDQFYQRYGIKP